MARLHCIRCGFEFRYTSLGRSGGRAQISGTIVQQCPVLNERLKEKGQLSGDGLDCPNVNEAISRYLNSRRR